MALPWPLVIVPWSWDSTLALAMVVVLILGHKTSLVFINHNYYIVTLVYKIAVKKLKKISFIMGFQDLCSFVSVENIIPDNFRVLTFSWNGPERPLFACFMFCHRKYLAVLPQSCGNFKWSELLTRLLFLGGSNCYGFLVKSSNTICNDPISYFYHFDQVSPRKSLVYLFKYLILTIIYNNLFYSFLYIMDMNTRHNIAWMICK